MLSLDFTFLYAGDKYELSSQEKTFGKDDVGVSKHTLHARRKNYCKLEGSCWVFALEPSDKKELVFCEICFWIHALFTCLLEYDILQIYSTRHAAEPLNERNEAFHGCCIRPGTSLLMSWNGAYVQKCKGKLC